MSTTETFWFLFWRMAFWGLGLGLSLGAVYGTLVGMPFYPFGLIFGPLLGAMYATLAGLALGIGLCRGLRRFDPRGNLRPTPLRQDPSHLVPCTRQGPRLSCYGGCDVRARGFNALAGRLAVARMSRSQQPWSLACP